MIYNNHAGWFHSGATVPDLGISAGGGPATPIPREQYMLGQSVTNVVVNLEDKICRDDAFWDVPVHFDVVVPVADISTVDLVPLNIYSGLQYRVVDSATGADVTAKVQLPGPKPFNTARLETAHPITTLSGPHVISIACSEKLVVRNASMALDVKIISTTPEPDREVAETDTGRKRFGIFRR